MPDAAIAPHQLDAIDFAVGPLPEDEPGDLLLSLCLQLLAPVFLEPARLVAADEHGLLALVQPFASEDVLAQQACPLVAVRPRERLALELRVTRQLVHDDGHDVTVLRVDDGRAAVAEEDRAIRDLMDKLLPVLPRAVEHVLVQLAHPYVAIGPSHATSQELAADEHGGAGHEHLVVDMRHDEDRRLIAGQLADVTADLQLPAVTVVPAASHSPLTTIARPGRAVVPPQPAILQRGGTPVVVAHDRAALDGQADLLAVRQREHGVGDPRSALLHGVLGAHQPLALNVLDLQRAVPDVAVAPHELAIDRLCEAVGALYIGYEPVQARHSDIVLHGVVRPLDLVPGDRDEGRVGLVARQPQALPALLAEGLELQLIRHDDRHRRLRRPAIKSLRLHLLR
mmetsp:Transcript_49915/g.128761  ORF Transcript_49915/g.128761 Transcript_49915/m.128761 type:complete len:397 (-) Transcript_49915:1827-3017(-)